MSDNRQVASSLLKEAHETITAKRPGVHGSAEQSFTLIAELWMIYLRHLRRIRKSDVIKPEDVAQMMSMLKKARAAYGDVTNADNFVDDAGYTALAGMLQLPDPEADRPASADAGRAAPATAVIHTKHEDIRTGGPENPLNETSLMERLSAINTGTE